MFGRGPLAHNGYAAGIWFLTVRFDWPAPAGFIVVTLWLVLLPMLGMVGLMAATMAIPLGYLLAPLMAFRWRRSTPGWLPEPKQAARWALGALAGLCLLLVVSFFADDPWFGAGFLLVVPLLNGFALFALGDQQAAQRPQLAEALLGGARPSLPGGRPFLRRKSVAARFRSASPFWGCSRFRSFRSASRRMGSSPQDCCPWR